MILLVPLFAAGAIADENMTGKRELGMDRCPSAVPGASTRVTDIPSGVVVTVTAKDPLGQQEIRRRVQIQLEVNAQTERGAIEHTGLGTGSGRFGFCPGMGERTSLRVEWTTDGAVMTIHPDRAQDVKRLQSVTHKRARWLQARMHETASR